MKLTGFQNVLHLAQGTHIVWWDLRQFFAFLEDLEFPLKKEWGRFSLDYLLGSFQS